MINILKRDYLLFLIIFFSFSPFLPRIVSGIDNQPFVFFLILLDYIVYIKRIRLFDLVFYCFCFLLISISFFWNFLLGFNYVDFGAIINVNLIIVYVVYFNSQFSFIHKSFESNNSFLLIYFLIAAILFYFFNGEIERSLFSFRVYMENDSSRGIYPLSPEPSAYAKILMVFALSCIIVNAKFLKLKIIVVSALLILNASGMGFLGLISIIPFLLFKSENRVYLYIFLLVVLIFIFNYVDFENLSSKRVYVLIDNIKEFDINFLEMYDMSLANRFNSFLLSYSKFIESPFFGRFFTFDSIGGYISVIGYLGIAPLFLLIYLLYNCILLPRILILPSMVFIGLFIFSDSYVLPCFYILFAFIINQKKIRSDNFYNTPS